MENFTTIVALIGIVIVTASLLSSALDRSGIPLAAAFLLVGLLLGPSGAGIVDIGLHTPISAELRSRRAREQRGRHG